MGVASHYALLSRRAVLNIVREPVAIIPSLTFPLLFLALNSAALERATQLPGFPPVESFLQFAVGTTIIQGAMFGAIAAGSAMATDIEGGFFERLIATPVSRISLLVSRVAGAALLSFLQAWIFFGVTLLFGLTVEGGLVSMVAVAFVASVFGAGVGAISMIFALRTGSSEAVQGAFPALFVFMFISSAFFPRDLMDGWFKTVATANPLSHMIEGVRGLIIGDFNWADTGKALAVAAGLFVLGLIASVAALRRRLAVMS